MYYRAQLYADLSMSISPSWGLWGSRLCSTGLSFLWLNPPHKLKLPLIFIMLGESSCFFSPWWSRARAESTDRSSSKALHLRPARRDPDDRCLLAKLRDCWVLAFLANGSHTKKRRARPSLSLSPFGCTSEGHRELFSSERNALRS